MSENKSFDELLLPVRNDIDRIDKELLKLFTERMQCAERVAEIKRKAGIPVLNAAREQVILDRVKKEAGEYGDSAVALYSAIMSISRARQHNMLKSGGVLRDLEQNSPKTLKADPRVICQGAAGAFSHSAALRLFPGQKPIFLPGFRDVFEAVHNGAGDYGVVPVENSDAGSVSEVYDLIMKHRMFIVGAADIPVRHCLCRAKGTGAVKKVLSKHEALVQCSAYLAAHVIETEAYSNTAAAAKFIAETRPEGVGAGYWNGSGDCYVRTVIMNTVVPPQYLSSSNPYGGKVTASTLPMYQDHSASSRQITTLRINTSVNILDYYRDSSTKQSWYKVSASGKSGWVRAGDVAFNSTSGLTHDLNYVDAYTFGSNLLDWHVAGGNCYIGLYYRRLAEAKVFSYGNYAEASPSNGNYKKNTYGYKVPSCL